MAFEFLEAFVSIKLRGLEEVNSQLKKAEKASEKTVGRISRAAARASRANARAFDKLVDRLIAAQSRQERNLRAANRRLQQQQRVFNQARLREGQRVYDGLLASARRLRREEDQQARRLRAANRQLGNIQRAFSRAQLRDNERVHRALVASARRLGRIQRQEAAARAAADRQAARVAETAARSLAATFEQIGRAQRKASGELFSQFFGGGRIAGISRFAKNLATVAPQVAALATRLGPLRAAVVGLGAAMAVGALVAIRFARSLALITVEGLTAAFQSLAIATRRVFPILSSSLSLVVGLLRVFAAVIRRAGLVVGAVLLPTFLHIGRVLLGAGIVIQSVATAFRVLASVARRLAAVLRAGLVRGFRLVRSGVALLLTPMRFLIREIQRIIRFLPLLVGLLGRQLARALTEVALEMERIQNVFRFTFGRRSADQLADIANEASRLGISFREAARPFSRLAFSFQALRLSEQDLRDTFIGVSEASVTLGIQGDQLTGVFLALQQIVDKNKLSAEELRRQLANAGLPAVTITARALGISVEELDKRLRAGSITAKEFFEVFGKQLRSDFGFAARIVGQFSQRARLARLQNEFFFFQAAIANRVVPALISLGDALRKVVLTGPVRKLFEDLAESAGRFIRSLAASETIRQFILGLAAQFRTLLPIIVSLGRQVAVLNAIVAGTLATAFRVLAIRVLPVVTEAIRRVNVAFGELFGVKNLSSVRDVILLFDVLQRNLDGLFDILGELVQFVRDQLRVVAELFATRGREIGELFGKVLIAGLKLGIRAVIAEVERLVFAINKTLKNSDLGAFTVLGIQQSVLIPVLQFTDTVQGALGDAKRDAIDFKNAVSGIKEAFGDLGAEIKQNSTKFLPRLLDQLKAFQDRFGLEFEARQQLAAVLTGARIIADKTRQVLSEPMLDLIGKLFRPDTSDIEEAADRISQTFSGGLTDAAGAINSLNLAGVKENEGKKHTRQNEQTNLTLGKILQAVTALGAAPGLPLGAPPP